MTRAQKNGLVEFLLLPLISLVWLVAATGCLLMALAKRIGHFRPGGDAAASPNRHAGTEQPQAAQTPLPNIAKIRRRSRRAHEGIAARRA
jgi:hypothetical protein